MKTKYYADVCGVHIEILKRCINKVVDKES